MDSTESLVTASNAENTEAQVDETVALQLIYGGDEFRLLSNHQFIDEDEEVRFEHPIRYTIRLSSDLALAVEYPPNYPDEEPILSVEDDDGAFLAECLANEGNSGVISTDLSNDDRHRLLAAIQEEVEIGIPCVMQCVQVGREFLSELKQQDTPELGHQDQTDGETFDVTNPTVSSSDRSYFDALPRPVLNSILGYCTVRDRGRLCVASRLIRTIVERRSRRMLNEVQESDAPTGGDVEHDWEWRYTDAGMTIDGEPLERWELDVRQADEEQQRSYHEQMWRKERSCQFDFSLPQPPRWRLREGLMRAKCSNDETEFGNDNFHIWTDRGGHDEAPGRLGLGTVHSPSYHFHSLRTSNPIYFDDCNHNTHWYLVRVRLRCRFARDGDIFVGLVHAQDFDAAPAESFGDTQPGGGYGAETDRCALINVLSGDNAVGHHPMEVNLGLKVSRTMNSETNFNSGFSYNLWYGIPVGAYFGRPEFNQGKVHSNWDSWRDVHVAVVVAATREQRDLRASVSVQECSRQEWEREMVHPYNFL